LTVRRAVGLDQELHGLQITDAPKVLRIVTTPTPTSLPFSYNGAELTLPLCGSGIDFEKTDQKMTWKATNTYNLFNFIDFAGGVKLYQRVRVSGLCESMGR
jgi:hypothetical protein